MAHFITIENPFDRRMDRFAQSNAATIWDWLVSTDPEFVGFETPTICCINGEPALQADWKNRRLGPVDVVTISPAVGAVALAIVAVIAAVAALAISLTVPDPKIPGNVPEGESVYSLRGQYNQYRLGQPIEVNFGTVRRWPAYAASVYNKYINNEQYYYALFCVGQGRHDAIDALLEDTQIANFEEAEFDFIAPGEDLNVFENNVVTSAEIGGIELFGPNEEEFSDWTGPFILNPANTTTNRIELDFVCPAGLYFSNDDGGLSLRQIEFSVEFQKVDDNGNPVGDWIDSSTYMVTETRTRKVYRGRGVASAGHWKLASSVWGSTDGEGESGDIIDIYSDPLYGLDQTWTRRIYTAQRTYQDRTTTPLRFTEEYSLPENARWQVRAKRTNDASDSHRVGDTLKWENGRAFLPNTTDFGDVTLLAFRARATNNLNDNSQQRVNVWVTRELPTWSAEAGWSDPVATRSIVWAFCEIFRAKYGGGLADNLLDLESLAALDEFYEGRGEYFDYVFDNKTTIHEAAKTVARAGRAVPMIVGTQLTIIRDGAATVPTALFGPHNIIRGSFEWEISLYDDSEPDAIEVVYVDPDTFQEETIVCSLDDDPSEPQRPKRVNLPGVTDRDVAYREGLYTRANQRHVREQVKFKTGLEGRIPTYGAFIGVAHDLPQWGQSGRIRSISGDTITTQDVVEWTEGESHQVALRDRYGNTIGPYNATRGDTDKEIVLPFELSPSTIDLLVQDDGTGQPSLLLFGITNSFYRQMKVTRIQNSGNNQVQITAMNYSAIPHSFDGVVAPLKTDTSAVINLPDVPVMGEIAVDVLPNSLTEVTVKWLPVVGANKYRVEQSYDEGTNYVASTEVTTNFAHLSVTPGEVYLRVAPIGQESGQYSYWNGTVGVIPEGVEFAPASGGIVQDEFDIGIAITSDTVGAEIRWSKSSMPQNVTQGEEYTEPVGVTAPTDTIYARAFIGSLLAGPGSSATYELLTERYTIGGDARITIDGKRRVTIL